MAEVNLTEPFFIGLMDSVHGQYKLEVKSTRLLTCSRYHPPLLPGSLSLWLLDQGNSYGT